jgi:hypothetical protein
MSTINDNLCHDILDGIDAIFNSGTLEIRTGGSPGAANAATGTLLASLTLPSDAFNSASSRTKSLSATITDLSADNSGTAGYARLKNGAGTRIIDMSVGVGSGELQLSTLTFVAGGVVNITGLTLGLSNTGT